MTGDPIVWVWRTLPRWTLDADLANGMQPTEAAVKRAAEAAGCGSRGLRKPRS
jgi:hypothetical protein